jgi:hypothetical protein
VATNMTFVDYVTPIPADWLNNVNTVVNSITPGNTSTTLSSISALRATSHLVHQSALLLGYYASGDGGGGNYYYVASDTTSSDNGGTIIVASDGGRWYLAPIDVLSVKQFGAKGNGTTNDTTAIQNAINWVSGLAVSDFWATYAPALRAPFGLYNINGLTISQPIQFYGDGEEATVFELVSGSNAHMITVSDMGGLTGADNGNIMPSISFMTFNGNSSGQVGTTWDGIHLTDASVPITTSYHGGANLTNLTFRACTRYALYIGQNRNNGRLEQFKSLYSGNDTVNANGYDWRVADTDIGNSQGGAGWNQVLGGATEFANCNLFFNQLAGLSIQAGVNASCTITNSYLDTNGSQGVFLDNSYGDIVAHMITNCVFRDNSRITGNNVSPHIQLNNQPFTIVANNTFIVNTQSTQPNYLVQFTGTVGPCMFVGNQFEVNDGLNIPYRTAITNNFLQLYVSGTEKVGLAQLGASTMGVIGQSGVNFDFYDSSSVTTQRRFRHNVVGSVYTFSTTSDDGTTSSPVYTVTRSGTTPVSINTIPVLPMTDNVFPLGGASFRWTTVYAATGTINTSDVNQKEAIQEIDPLLLNAFATLTPKQFKMKGGTRWHVGYIAQELELAIKEQGGNPADYACWCEDEVNGEKQQGLRYDQVAVLRDALDKRKQ